MLVPSVLYDQSFCGVQKVEINIYRTSAHDGSKAYTSHVHGDRNTPVLEEGTLKRSSRPCITEEPLVLEHLELYLLFYHTKQTSRGSSLDCFQEALCHNATESNIYQPKVLKLIRPSIWECPAWK